MTPRDRRAVWLGLGTIVLATVLLRLVPWTVRAVRSLRERAEARAELLAAAQRTLAEAPAARDSLRSALEQFLALAPRLVPGQTSAEAGSALSGLISQRALAAGLRLTQLDQLADSSAGTFSRVAIKGTLEGDVRGLTELVGAIESGDPVLSLDALAVTATNAANTSPNVPEALRVEVTLHGWFLPRVTKPVTAPSDGSTP